MEESIVERKKGKFRNKKRNVQEQFRVIVGNKANESLEKIILQVNDGFNCGTITKSNILDWLLTRLDGTITQVEAKALQELYIDEKKMLQDLLRESTITGKSLPPSIREVLKEHFGFSGKAQRKSRKLES